MQVTEWIPGSRRPRHSGWYQVALFNCPEPADYYWNGKSWGYWVGAQRPENWWDVFIGSNDKWRGLARGAN